MLRALVADTAVCVKHEFLHAGKQAQDEFRVELLQTADEHAAVIGSRIVPTTH